MVELFEPRVLPQAIDKIKKNNEIIKKILLIKTPDKNFTAVDQYAHPNKKISLLGDEKFVPPSEYKSGYRVVRKPLK